MVFEKSTSPISFAEESASGHHLKKPSGVLDTQWKFDPILEGLEYIASWIEENNYTIIGPYRELILEFPNEYDFKNVIVEIQIPVVKS